MTNGKLADECERVTGATWMSTAHGPICGPIRIAAVKGGYMAILRVRGLALPGRGCSVRGALSDLFWELGADIDHMADGRRVLARMLGGVSN